MLRQRRLRFNSGKSSLQVKHSRHLDDDASHGTGVPGAASGRKRPFASRHGAGVCGAAAASN